MEARFAFGFSSHPFLGRNEICRPTLFQNAATPGRETSAPVPGPGGRRPLGCVFAVPIGRTLGRPAARRYQLGIDDLVDARYLEPRPLRPARASALSIIRSLRATGVEIRPAPA